MDWTSTWPAPAKLNLFLHIVGRRADGYHLLQTVFQLLDIGDSLQFSAREDGRVRRVTELPDVPESDDLTVRAALALQAASGTGQGVDISLDKRLPMGGGLGGGSSNAATVLVALNHLWQCGLSAEALLELAAELGADVPVFVAGSSAWAEGIGEQLSPMNLPEAWYVVVTPDCHIDTGKLFAHPQLTRNSPISTMPAFSQGDGIFLNCFEALVRREYSAVEACFKKLSAYGQPRLTGTGSSVFLSFEDRASASAVAAQLRKQEQGREQVFLARGVNQSPLHSQLNLQLDRQLFLSR